jgi:AcrR family transcriptional regulator
MTTPSTTKSKKPAVRRRTRRSPEELTRRLLDSAVEEFAANGYAAARTAAIAQRADVVEPLLFKYFGSKANLFQRAIYDTLDRNYTSFTASHVFDIKDKESWIEQSKEYIGQQQDFLRENSRMFMSLILNEAFESEDLEGVDGLSGLQAFLDKMSTFAEKRPIDTNVTDSALIARISFGSLLACVLFRDWLFPTGIASDEKIRSAVIDFVLKGADMAPPHSQSAVVEGRVD